jgi:hypothetical protein
MMSFGMGTASKSVWYDLVRKKVDDEESGLVDGCFQLLNHPRLSYLYPSHSKRSHVAKEPHDQQTAPTGAHRQKALFPLTAR